MHMNDGRVVSNFILQALQGEPLTVCVHSFVLCDLNYYLLGVPRKYVSSFDRDS